jgi:hypothetical protein
MKVNNWLVVLLVLIGVAVGSISLYMASLSGVMGKMGLVGGDFSQDIDKNELARQLRDREQLDCGIWKATKLVPEFLIANGERKIILAGQLGKERVICGISLVQHGNVERGVYSIIKGLHYLSGQYNQMQQIVRKDASKCQLLAGTDYDNLIQGYLRATKGRIHDIVFDLYKQVEIERAGVDELCTE